MGEQGGRIAPESLFAEGDLTTWARPRLEAVRRRWRRVLLMTLLFGVAAIGALKVWPKSYHATAVLFAMPAEDSPGSVRGPSGGTQGLADGAAEVIATRSALRQVVRKLELTPSWEESRAGSVAWLDRAREWLGLASPADTPEDRALDALVDRLQVVVDHAEVRVIADWPDPQLAYQIAKDAGDRLIAARRRTEIAPLDAKAQVLANQAELASREVDADVDALQRSVVRKRRGAVASTVRGLQAQGRFRHLPDAKLAALRRTLIAKRQAIADLEDVRRKRLAELTATLAEERATLGPVNPKVLDTQGALAAVDREELRLQAMKDEEQQLLERFVSQGGNERELEASPAQLFAPELEQDDEGLTYQRQALALELGKLREVQGEALEARVRVSAAMAEFGGRYFVLEAPTVPRHPASPRRILVCLSALLAGLFLGSLWAVTLELGRAPSPMQVAPP